LGACNQASAIGSMIVDNLCCFLQEVAAEMVQKLQPHEASTMFIEVKSENHFIPFCFGLFSLKPC